MSETTETTYTNIPNVNSAILAELVKLNTRVNASETGNAVIDVLSDIHSELVAIHSVLGEFAKLANEFGDKADGMLKGVGNNPLLGMLGKMF